MLIFRCKILLFKRQKKDFVTYSVLNYMSQGDCKGAWLSAVHILLAIDFASVINTKL